MVLSAGHSSIESAHVYVRLTNVTKRFGRRRVLHQLSAEVETGKVLGITGPNGSGKSTLIRIIAGLLMPDRGEALVEFTGRPLDRFERRRITGWVAADTGLYGSLTGAEHVWLSASLRGLSPRRSDVADILRMVGLSGRGDDPVRTYSSGMRQRLRYACALVHEPVLWLLDEPFANLDEAGADLVRELVHTQRQRGATIVAGNDARELAMADEVIVLETAV